MSRLVRTGIEGAGGPGHASRASLTVVEIDDRDEAVDVVGSLAAAAFHPFASAAWIGAAWRGAAEQGQAPRLLVARDGDGTAVGAWALERMGPTLQPLATTLADLGDPLSCPADGQRVAAALAEWLRCSGAKFTATTVGPDAARALRRVGARPIGPPVPSPVITIGSRSWVEYLAGPGARRRRRFVAQAARALASDEIDVVDATEPASVEDALAYLVRLHDLRFGEASRAFTPPRRRFFERVLPALAVEGGVCLRLLRWRRSPVAALLLFRWAGSAWYYQSGFDPRHADRSVGRVLFADTVRTTWESGAERFHLLRGDEPYKSWWADADEPVQQLGLAGTAS